MNSPTNPTDRLSHHRQRNGESDIIDPQAPRPNPKCSKGSTLTERRFATDTFMLFAYSLLGIAALCQLGLIVWLDLI